MNYIDILNKIQTDLLAIQSSINELRCIDDTSIADVYITRQEAADMLGKGLRQLDRDCIRYNIRRQKCNNGVRISKRDIMRHLGYFAPEPEDLEPPEEEKMTEFDRIMYRHNKRMRR